MSNMSSPSSDSASTSSIPKLPNDRGQFDNWRMVMRAYLDDKGVWSVVSAGEGTGVSTSASLSVSSNSSSSTKSADSKGKDADDGSTPNPSPSPGAEDLEGGKLKKKAWLILLQSCWKASHYDHAKQVTYGDPAALWKRLNSSYGIVKTAETMAALHSQLASLRMHRKETMDDYIARADKLISDLRSAGNDILKAQRKLYILQGLNDFPEWETAIEFIRKMDKDDTWSIDEFDQALISDDKARRLRQSININAPDVSHFTQSNRGRGRGSGGRGKHWSGRGRVNHTRNKDYQNENKNNNDGVHRGDNRGSAFQGNNQGNYNNSNNNKRNMNNRSNKSHIQCYNCGNYGHYQNECADAKKDNAMNANDDGGVDTCFMISNKAVTLNRMIPSVHHAPSLVDYALTANVAMSEFVFDSGATSHFTGQKGLLFDIQTLDTPVVVRTGNSESSYDVIGKIHLPVNGVVYTLTDVAYVPGFSTNLISVSKLMDKGLTFTCDPLKKAAVVSRNGHTLFCVPRRGNLFVISPERSYAANDNVGSVTTHSDEAVKKEMRRMHVLLGHQSYSQLHKLIKNNSVEDITPSMKKVNNKIITELIHEQCDGCMKGKMIRLPMTGKIDYHADGEMQVWAGDVIGPIKGMSLVGNEYVLNNVDVGAARMYVDVMKHKSEATSKTKKQINEMQTKTKKKVKRYHSDGGGEFVNDELDEFFAENGTVHTTTTAHTAQHNPAERANRTLIEQARSMMHYSGVPRYLGDEAIMCASILLDVRISKVDDVKTPFELCEKRKPRMNRMHVFGCDVYRYNHKEDRDGKLDETGKKGIFVGYDRSNGSYYRVLDMDQMKVIRTRDVKFFDDKFDNAKLLSARQRREEDGAEDYEVLQFVNQDDYVDDDVDIEALFKGESGNVNNANDATNEERVVTDDNSDKRVLTDVNSDNRVVTDVSSDNRVDTDDSRVDHNTRSLANDDVGDSTSDDANVDKKEEKVKRERTKAKIFTPEDFRVKKKRVAEALVSIDDEPMTYKQAIASADAKEWLQSIKEEVNSLQKNQTWVEMNREEWMNVIGSKWVFKKKKDENGNVQRYKSRLVAKGYNQEYGVDYNETFAPVLKYKSFRLLLILAILFDLEVDQMDVKTAFLNADVDEDIYLDVPDGVNVSKNKVLKLLKALYGIKQAPKAWNDNINAYLLSLGFTACIKDTCIYVKRTKTNNDIMLGLFVDDVMPVYNKRDKNEWLQYKQQLMTKYEVSDLGRVNHILGMKVSFNGDKICIDQHVYVKEKLNEFNMHECKMMKTPEQSGVKLVEAAENEKLDDKYTKMMRGIVGSVMYASVSTRPDITHAVNMVARFMAKPGHHHLIAAKCILRYLQGTQHLGLVYQKDERMKDDGDKKTVTVTGYCDSDWGGDLVTRKSTTGYCVFVNNNLVSWNTKKQQTVATSSAEAEVMASVEVVKEVKWLQQMLSELGFIVKTPTIVFCDNQSAIRISEKDVQHDRTKHIDIKYHFVKDELRSKNIEMKYISTDKQLADIFTKGLSSTVFVRLRDELMKQ